MVKSQILQQQNTRSYSLCHVMILLLILSFGFIGLVLEIIDIIMGYQNFIK